MPTLSIFDFVARPIWEICESVDSPDRCDVISFTLFLFVMSIFIFTYGMNELAEVGIGSFIGEGSLDINIPGEEKTQRSLLSMSGIVDRVIISFSSV